MSVSGHIDMGGTEKSGSPVACSLQRSGTKRSDIPDAYVFLVTALNESLVCRRIDSGICASAHQTFIDLDFEEVATFQRRFNNP